MTSTLLEAGSEDEVDGVPATLVARPTDTAEVAAVMTEAAARGLTVLPCGRRTKLGWGSPPSSADVLLDLSGLDRVLDHQAGDLILDTQAGVRLSEVQRVAGEQRQRLVLDEMVPGASVGGVLATNTSGPERLLAGTARDLLIGITVVRADGVVAKAGGRVVKNVAGYDLGKLMIGSFGTLGVITEAVFRLHPVPDVRRWVWVEVTGPDEAHRLAQEVVHSQAVPGALEVDLEPSGAGTLTVMLAGRESAVAQRAQTIGALLGTDCRVADGAPAGWAAYPWTPGEIGLKLTCVLSGLRDVLAAAVAAGVRVRGSAGTGVLYAATDDPAALAPLRAVCTHHGGSAVVVTAPRELTTSLDLWGPVPALDLMRRVKDQFDPEHRLAPGRFVGGI